MKCKIDGCKNAIRAKGYCVKHYQRLLKHGDPLKILTRENGQGELTHGGYIVHTINYEKFYEHIMIAEHAIGKKLPTGAVVHHIDGNRANNNNSNLVICPNEYYHNLLHTRARWISYLKTPSLEGIDFPTRVRTAYTARIKLNGKKLHIGSFATQAEAIEARCQVIRSLLAGHPYRGEYL